MYSWVDDLVRRYPVLRCCESDITASIELLADVFRRGGKLLVCGNGGSAADSEHIVGELMKSFRLPRPLPDPMRRNLLQAHSQEGAYLAEHLQGALPTLALTSSTVLATAIANDIASDMVFAQQVYGYGQADDVVLAISTSGNSPNVCRALQVARSLKMHTIGLTGASGGRFLELCELVIRVPAEDVAEIQELHLPIYHVICSVLEELFFGEANPYRS